MKALSSTLRATAVLGIFLGCLFLIIAHAEQSDIKEAKETGRLQSGKAISLVSRNSSLYIEVLWYDKTGMFHTKLARIPKSLYSEYIDDNHQFLKNTPPLEIYDVDDKDEVFSKAYTEPGGPLFIHEYWFSFLFIGTGILSILLMVPGLQRKNLIKKTESR